MAKVGIVAEWRKPKRKKDGNAPIWIRVRTKGDTRYHALGIEIRRDDWSERREMVKDSHPHHARLNSIIQEAKQKATSFYLECLRDNKAITATKITSHLKDSRSTNSFSVYARDYLDNLSRFNRHTYVNNRTAVNKFFEFCRPEFGDDIPFNALSKGLISRFDKHMHTLGNAESTRALHLGVINSIIKEAKADGYCGKQVRPFENLKMPKAKSAVVDVLTREEIKALEDVDLTGDDFAELSRDLFIFSYYCWGMRFGDVVGLKGSNLENGVLTYVTSKTDQTLTFTLQDSALFIAIRYKSGPDDFLFPPLRRKPIRGRTDLASRKVYANGRVNKGLKRACKLAGITKDITFHVSRHSITAHAMAKGMNFFTIQHFLAHSDPTVTAEYTKSWKPLDLQSDMTSFYDSLD